MIDPMLNNTQFESKRGEGGKHGNDEGIMEAGRQTQNKLECRKL